MKNLIIALIVTASIVYGCSKTGGMEGSSAGSEQEHSHKKRVIMLHPNMYEEKQIQKAVDNGGQRWRLNPIDVAHANMINHGVNARIEDCDLVSKDESHAVVKVHPKDGKDLNVHVERLVRSDGIWTATQVEMEEDDSIPAESAHDHNHHH